MTLQSKEIKPFIGSQVLNSKEELLSGKYATEIRELLEQRGVLVFPEINFTDEEQVAFTKTLGKFAPELLNAGEEVHKITLDTKHSASAEYLKGSMYWHIDGTMNKVPILASILSGKVLSPEGGQTEFCNTYAAYEQLSDKEKAEYDGLTVMHSAWNSLFFYEPEPSVQKLQAMMAIGDAELPLVWAHQSGRKSLVLGCTAYQVVDKPAKESALILNKLRDWATQEQFTYSHEWTVGDTVMWDNTGTMHRARPYDPACGRMMHRTKLEGEEPIVAAAS
ncbi:TauD/TfdA family dioxygenase [Halioxenophilus sp. WMMB6]|uniref:TauD/TfdA dioxygenase family protein n=1 Tax=Halioxenophilus sp. WMMB6 TaxID=3073815 RepID=UPI00295F3DF8|nr:TauD/TfdA family dioxygenase [Halioxenophilus sp. WMMB6]